MITFFYIRL